MDTREAGVQTDMPQDGASPDEGAQAGTIYAGSEIGVSSNSAAQVEETYRGGNAF